MKFLIVDHFFGQDIESLRIMAREHELRIVSPKLLSKVARKFFPPDVFASLLGETFASPFLADARQRYEKEASKVLWSLYYTFFFDALILPSDTIFYLRAWISAAHAIGIPVIILQKETSISPYSLTEDARAIGQFLPFIGDLMLVCSDHHKQFWLNAGADAQKIMVTGQPRFDFYCKPEYWKPLDNLGIYFPKSRPIILFFSYDLAAYSPEGILAPVWTKLRTETEQVLVNLARQGHFNLLIKPHPQQQDIQDSQVRLAKMAGDSWGEAVQWLPGGMDIRPLIVNSQVIVGFQTTAMFEAIAAGKKVIYTFWTEATTRLNKGLLPFHQMGDVLLVAHSPEELVSQLLSDQEGPNSNRHQEIEKQLGPLDGKATERCWGIMESFIIEYTKHADANAVALRHSLIARAPIYCRQVLPLARLAEIFWKLVERLLPLICFLWLVRGRLLGKQYRSFPTSKIVERRQAAEEKVADCYLTLVHSNKLKAASKTF